MTDRGADTFGALDRALRDSAIERASNVVADARADATARVDRARREAEARIQHAREQGKASAAEDVAHDRARVRRDAAATVLTAEREVVDRARDHVRTAVLALRDTPDYPAIVRGLAARSRAQLGPRTAIIEDPPGRGGVLAELDGRRVDNSLHALADRAFDSIEDRLREQSS